MNLHGIAAFDKIEESKNVFQPISRDSLISGEKSMADLVGGLQASLDFNIEQEVSTLSGFDRAQLSQAVRGKATPTIHRSSDFGVPYRDKSAIETTRFSTIIWSSIDWCVFGGTDGS